MSKMKEGYFELLEKAYQKAPGLVLFLLSGNAAYRNSDAATIRIFPKLAPLHTDYCEHRKKKWWDKRHSVLYHLAKKHIITEAQRFEYAEERRGNDSV